MLFSSKVRSLELNKNKNAHLVVVINTNAFRSEHFENPHTNIFITEVDVKISQLKRMPGYN